MNVYHIVFRGFAKCNKEVVEHIVGYEIDIFLRLVELINREVTNGEDGT